MNWFVGTYSKRNSKGIYLLDLDETNGELQILKDFESISPLNPSFLEFDKNNNLYSVGESEAPNPGVVVSYRFSKNQLEKLSQVFTNGNNPCHLSINNANNFLVAVNYSSGDFSTYKVLNGKLKFIEKISHNGSSINNLRQNEPHAHSINFIDNNNFFVCDLGVDKIFKYTTDPNSLSIIQQKSYKMTPGSGPRHFVINSREQFAYSINELDSTITVFQIDSKKDLLPIQNISTIPEHFTGETTTADLHFSKNNKYLYGSNRGHDSLAKFSIDNQGRLTFENFFSTLGKTPRNFSISKSGKFCLVANENSDNIISFHIDQNNGDLEPTGNKVNIPSPVCLLEIIE